MVLQQAMFPTEPAVAEAAVADDPLRRIPAVLERAALLPWRHAASERQRQVQGRLALDAVGLERRRGVVEVLAGEDEAEVGEGDGGAAGEEGAEVGDGESGRDGERYCCRRGRDRG